MMNKDLQVKVSLYVKGFGEAAVQKYGCKKNFAKKYKIMKEQTSSATRTSDEGKTTIDLTGKTIYVDIDMHK